jgi:RNA polymerase-binding transcription factor DksA
MPLSDAQRRHLERRLIEERTRALELLGRSLHELAGADAQDRAGDLTLMPFHPADRGTDTMDDELEMSNTSRVSRELEAIDAALARLYETPEQFGRCGDTGGEIAFERLDLVPWARSCAEAASRR